MKAVIAGSGNVAQLLGRALRRTPGLELLQIYGRGASGRMLAGELAVGFAGNPSEVAAADIYIIAVSDSSIAEVAGKLAGVKAVADGRAVVVHTAGGVGIGALDGTPHRGVLYPLQTFTKGRELDFRHIPVFIEYSSPHAEDVLREVAGRLSDNVHPADAMQRLRLHTAAVFAGNFTNHLYAIAERLLREGGLDFEILKPLIAEVAAKAIASSDPAAVQTGPATRGDYSTQEHHREFLDAEGHGRYEEIYKLLSQSIWETSKKI